jgi:hypothetical protein
MTRRFALVAALVVLATGLAGATTLVKMGFGDLARDANYVVVGTVTGVEGEWDPGFNFIHSNVTLEVERSLQGRAPRTLVVRTPGGRIGSEGQVAEGMATFEVGERVLVFLTTWEDGVGKVLGYEQGKSRVTSDAQGRARLKGGVADGRLLDAVERELRDGPSYNIPLQPAR